MKLNRKVFVFSLLLAFVVAFGSQPALATQAVELPPVEETTTEVEKTVAPVAPAVDETVLTAPVTESTIVAPEAESSVVVPEIKPQASTEPVVPVVPGDPVVPVEPVEPVDPVVPAPKPTITAVPGEAFVGAPMTAADMAKLFTALDDQSKPLAVTVTGTVDFNKVGAYTITGTATLGTETASVTTTVTVKANDNAKLVLLIAEAKKKVQADYTPASFQALTAAIASADKVVANQNATAKVIADEIVKLQAAIDALVVVEKPSGLVKEAAGLRYYDPETHVPYQNRWRTVDGKTYYFGADTYAVSGLVKDPTHGLPYYFDTVTNEQYKNRWRTVNGSTYYFNKHGVATTGYLELGGTKHFFGNDGVQFKNRWKTIGDKTYFFNANGTPTTGFKKDTNGAIYFFGTDGVQFKNRWKTDGAKTYYFNANGVTVKGKLVLAGVLHYFGDDGVQFKNRWKTIDGNTYFFNANGTVTRGLVRIDGLLNYFGADGVQYKDKYATVGTSTYFFKTNGVAQAGLMRVPGKSTYNYFHPTTNVMLKNAWFDKDGGRAYVNASGIMVTGSQTIGGRTYTFSSNGLVSGTWYVENGVFRKVDRYGRVQRSARVGSTYILIDLSGQDMYAYKSGRLLVSTNVITGKPTTPTPPGNYSIISKARNRILRGPMQPNGKYEWESFVNYWIAFRSGGYGIHDASWQASWKYTLSSPNRSYGSHGCVNTPYSKVQTIYNNFGYGTPVIVF